ncbi:MAG: dihydropyrimidine dehydrogenase, partial [Actinomycetes bacterium]|nr:dihydropyrimidine dehydrogenase [Actinomycetes bacterium]
MSTSRPARLPRVPMPLLDSDARRDSFDEVALGYDLDAARAEAARCLHCKRPRCEEGCPVGVLIRDFIAALSVGEVARGVALLKLRNALPAVCGRVCPQETQCEASCVLARKGDAIAIGRLERFLADWDRQLPANQRNATPLAQRKGRRAAIVGSGPASLTCAGELVLRGWDVDLFEGLHMAGGVLAYGIPEFRLPKSILADEIDQLRRRCVEFHFNEIIGKTCSVEDLLQEGYDTAFLGLGAGLPLFLGIPGETHNGVYSANE